MNVFETAAGQTPPNAVMTRALLHVMANYHPPVDVTPWRQVDGSLIPGFAARASVLALAHSGLISIGALDQIRYDLREELDK